MRVPRTPQRLLCFIQSTLTRGHARHTFGQETEERYPAIHNGRNGKEGDSRNKFGLAR